MVSFLIRVTQLIDWHSEEERQNSFLDSQQIYLIKQKQTFDGLISSVVCL